jgi:hypothetical protein
MGLERYGDMGQSEQSARDQDLRLTFGNPVPTSLNAIQPANETLLDLIAQVQNNVANATIHLDSIIGKMEGNPQQLVSRTAPAPIEHDIPASHICGILRGLINSATGLNAMAEHIDRLVG